MDGQDLLLFLLQDVSLEKRQEALQHIFFHDLLNLVEGLEGVACGLLEEPSRAERTACQIRDLSCQLSEEVQNQRVLLSAEEGCLVADTHPTRPSDILDRVRLVFARNEVAQGRRLVILPGPQGVFPTDPVLLTRVLVNLVKNAFEATPRGGTVKVWHLWREGERGFAVENPGAIPSEVAGHIFQRSYSTKGSPGRGMGTYGAKLLGERFLGGRVEFSCAEGATRFTVWVPDGGNPPPREPEGEESVVEILPAPMPEPEAGTCGGATVLVIDDSRTVRRLLGNILGKHYRVLLAENGEEGLVLATEEGPDLILLDVLMPGLDGFAVCSRLKGDSRTRDIPVLFLTALSGAVDEMRALEAGAIDFIPKPISPAILGARVRNHLDLKRYQDKLRNLSLLDGLTGIANRRRFDQYLELEWQRCSRNGQPLSLVLGDVDVFKAYNDGYGHGQGDDCLRRVAEVFQASLRRPADLAARYGGEEFVCILPETGREGARSVADQIMARMADLDLPHAFSPVAGRVTVSLGLATAELPVSAESWGGLLEQADRRLYLAKSRGRNRMEGP
jgi:diguanylate cyclase (GGDEF)-like protein